MIENNVFIFALDRNKKKKKEKKIKRHLFEKVNRMSNVQSHVLQLDRPFTHVTVSTTMKLLYYKLKKTNGTLFSPLDITLVERHWEDTLVGRVLLRNVFAVCASLFVDPQREFIHIFIRARDMREEALHFLFREVIDNGQVSVDAIITDCGSSYDEFQHNRRQYCKVASDQYHIFQERVRFVRKNNRV